MSDITVNNFKAFYEQIRPYLGAVHSGFTPIGTVISVMGTTAPLNYLACDGTVYNIADYTELAAYFNAQFGSSNFFGGNGTTTFAVPDLRGEFLRGTGTNSHANQGSGAAVGVHQDGTLNQSVIGDSNNKRIYAYTSNIGSNQHENSSVNYDSRLNASGDVVAPAGDFNNRTTSDGGHYTSRPTNTSVLYCIASKNIFMDAGSNYSTEEQVVGTWIDSKPIYQKTINFGYLPNATSKSVAHNVSGLNKLISAKANWVSSGPYYGDLSIMSSDGKAPINFWMDATKLYLWSNSDLSSRSAYVTLQYTKTTD